MTLSRPPFLIIITTRVTLERKRILEDQEGLEWWPNPVGQKVTSQHDLVHYLFVCILITVDLKSCANAADQLQELSCVWSVPVPFLKYLLRATRGRGLPWFCQVMVSSCQEGLPGDQRERDVKFKRSEQLVNIHVTFLGGRWQCG